jgi:hypothetical protein
MGRYQEALRGNKKNEERTLAEQLLKREDLPKDFRNYVQARGRKGK